MNSAANPIFRLNTKNPDAVISIFDDSLELNGRVRCDLFASVSSAEFALTLFDKKQNKFLALEVFQKPNEKDVDWIRKIPEVSLILKKKMYQSVSVQVINELTTIVPVALFHEEDANRYFNFNFNAGESLLKTEMIPAFDAINVYALPESLDAFIQQVFERPVVRHHFTVLLEAIHLSYKKFNEKLLLIHVRPGYVDIVVMEGKRLFFINSFHYKTIDDLAYYVMFVSDRLQLNPETISTFLMGQVEAGSALFHLLYKYINNVSLAPRPDMYEFSYVFDEIPEHFHFNLFNLVLCVS